MIGDNLKASYSNTKAVLEELGFTVDIAESNKYLVKKLNMVKNMTLFLVTIFTGMEQDQNV